MKNFHSLFCFFLIFFFLSGLPVLSQAGIHDDPPKVIKKTTEFLDQGPWPTLFQINQKFDEFTFLDMKELETKKPSASEIIVQLSDLLSKDESESQVQTAIEALNLSELGITAEVLKDLVEFIQAHFPNIKELNLSFNNIGAAGIDHLAKLSQLEKLELAGNQIGEAEAAHLAKLTQLKSLNLYGNQIGEAGAAHLAKLTQLKSLELFNNEIGEAGVAHLKTLSQLEKLHLSFNKIKTAGVAHLTALSQLKSLELSFNEIGEAGVVHLKTLSQLEMLDLSGNKIDDIPIYTLREALGKSVIIIY